MTRTDELVAAAADYISRGLRVIALTGKAPNVAVHKRGLYDALSKESIDPAKPLASLWYAFAHKDTTGIGILTGDPYYVVDIDGEAGAQAWAEILGVSLPIPERWVASTGRGLHLWYAHSKDWCDCHQEYRTAKLGDKLDFKGLGGYVAAPPSLHPNGNVYKWLMDPDDGPPLEMPQELHKILHRTQVVEASAFTKERDQMRSKRRTCALEDGKLWATTSFTGIISKMLNESEGNRNGMLYWCARTMIEEGAEQSDMDDLADAAMRAGLSGYEIRQTVKSAVRADRGN
jgi:hypothetical protein